jgi:hypothetical protein
MRGAFSAQLFSASKYSAQLIALVVTSTWFVDAQNLSVKHLDGLPHEGLALTFLHPLAIRLDGHRPQFDFSIGRQ